MSWPDILIDIQFPINEPDKFLLRTNASRSGVEEILEAWIRDQMGRGKDERTPTDRDIYRIRIGFNVGGDVFQTESDTGNAALTCGIVATVLRLFGEGKVALQELEKESTGGAG